MVRRLRLRPCIKARGERFRTVLPIQQRGSGQLPHASGQRTRGALRYPGAFGIGAFAEPHRPHGCTSSWQAHLPSRSLVPQAAASPDGSLELRHDAVFLCIHDDDFPEAWGKREMTLPIVAPALPGYGAVPPPKLLPSPPGWPRFNWCSRRLPACRRSVGFGTSCRRGQPPVGGDRGLGT